MFLSIFQFIDYLVTFKHVCAQCVQVAINSYIFANTSKLNSELLTSALNGLYYSIENTDESSDEYKTLFVSLNTEDFTSKQFYDSKRPVYNVTAAYKRFQSMVNIPKVKPKLEVEVYPANVKREKKKKLPGKCLIPIRTNDMMYDETDSIIKCKECLKIYPTKLGLRNHYIRVHAPKTYKCPECPKKFGSPAYLEAHKTESHCLIVCSDCGKTFNNKNTFKMHEMGHYLRLICQDCGRMYKNRTTYKKHIEFKVCGQKTRASPADAKFTCDYCNKKYTQKVSLRVHIQYEHGNYKAHVCEFCNKKFWAQSRLKAHMVKHTKERNFKCEVCNGKFVTKESLLYHTRIHTGDKPYECSQCDARFLSASRRSEHIKRQHTNASLECEICGCKFSSQTYLHKHKKTHYKTESQPEVKKMATTQKINEVDFRQLTQELKRLDSEDYELEPEGQLSEDETYLEFIDNEDKYSVHINT